MRTPSSLEEVAGLIETGQRLVFVFMASWCPDCHFIAPHLQEIEERFSSATFVVLDRDAFMPLAKEWDIFGIPSFVVIEDGREVGRLVNKLRKSKEEIIRFLEGLEEK